MMPPSAMDRRLRTAGVIITLGLLIQLSSLLWSHPTAFLAFAFLGGPLVLAGVAIFLYSLVSTRPS